MSETLLARVSLIEKIVSRLVDHWLFFCSGQNETY